MKGKGAQGTPSRYAPGSEDSTRGFTLENRLGRF
jgi:hypothetical protein